MLLSFVCKCTTLPKDMTEIYMIVWQCRSSFSGETVQMKLRRCFACRGQHKPIVVRGPYLRSSSSPISTPASRSMARASWYSSLRVGSKNLNGSDGNCLFTVWISVWNLYMEKIVFYTSRRQHTRKAIPSFVTRVHSSTMQKQLAEFSDFCLKRECFPLQISHVKKHIDAFCFLFSYSKWRLLLMCMKSERLSWK